MTPYIPKASSPRMISEHTESVLLFSTKNQVDGNNFERVVNDLKEGDYSDSLEIRFAPNGLHQIEKGGPDLWGNSTWIIDYDILATSLDDFDSAEVDAINQLRSELQSDMFPDVTAVYVYMDSQDNRQQDIRRVKDSIHKEYDVPQCGIVSGYSSLIEKLHTHFAFKIDPEWGPCCKAAIFEWAKVIRSRVDELDEINDLDER